MPTIPNFRLPSTLRKQGYPVLKSSRPGQQVGGKKEGGHCFGLLHFKDDTAFSHFLGGDGLVNVNIEAALFDSLNLSLSPIPGSFDYELSSRHNTPVRCPPIDQ